MKNLIMVFILAATVALLSAQDKSSTVQTESAKPVKIENSDLTGCDHLNKKCDSSSKQNCASTEKMCDSKSKCDHKKPSNWMFWKKSTNKSCCKVK